MSRNSHKRKFDELDPREAAEWSATDDQDEWKEQKAEPDTDCSSSSSIFSHFTPPLSSGHPTLAITEPGALSTESSQAYSRSPNSIKHTILNEQQSESIAPDEVEPKCSGTAIMKYEIVEKRKEHAPSVAKQAGQRQRGSALLTAQPEKIESNHRGILQYEPASMPMSIPGKFMLRSNPYTHATDYTVPKSKRQMRAEQVLWQQKEHFAPVLARQALSSKKSVHGGCLCGAVKWVYQGEIPSATLCNCTACRRYAALWAYSYVGDRIKTLGPTATFSRGDRNLEFHFCASCGCMAFWRACREIDGRIRIAVNLRMADPEDVRHIPIKMFDGLMTMSPINTSSIKRKCFVNL